MKRYFNCLILLAVFSFAGCGYKEDVKKIDLSKIEGPSDSIQLPVTLKIGIIPEQDIRKMAERYGPLAEYLSKTLNLKVELVYLDSYGQACGKFINKELDAAFFGSFSYALTRTKVGIEPVARPDYQGTSVYRGLIIVRSDSNIRNIAGMKGKRLALVNQATYAGYLFPLYYFRSGGINNPDSYFSKITFTGSHDKAIFALLRNEADVACPKDLVYQRIIKDNPDLEKKFVILFTSNAVPSNTLCVDKELDPKLKKKLKEALLNLKKDPAAKGVLESLGGATGFVETRDADYRYLYETLRALNIGLNTYLYYRRPDMGLGSAPDEAESK